MVQNWGISALVLVLLSLPLSMAATPIRLFRVPAVFILGDSTADVGTNNNLSSYAKANFPHNGIDFPGSVATGRFSNGLNTADYLCRKLGFRRSPPPFLQLLQQKVLYKHVQQGVNFASGGSGLLDGTGNKYVTVVPFSEQVKQFYNVSKVFTGFLGENATNSFISKSLIFISVGSNDLFEFFDANSTMNKQEFITNLTSTYESHLRMLYSYGARRFGIVSIPPVGCCPYYRAQNTSNTKGCMEGLNELSRMFFSSIELVLKQLADELEGMVYSLGNAYAMVTDFMDNPLPLNFTELQTACCGNGTYNGQAPCTKDAKLCPNRDQYLFWDMYHPTQAAASVAALTLYGGEREYVTPINFRTLAELIW